MSEPIGLSGARLAREGGRGRRSIAIGALAVLGIAGLVGGGTLLVREITRPAAGSQAQAATGQDIATRWQRLPAGQIFPPTVRYVNAENIPQSAQLVGIAPSASCLAGLDA